MSKLLVIMRHGDASMADEDFERPLSPWGLQAAAAVGKLLSAKGVAPDLVLASSAWRAATTAEQLCTQFSPTPPLEQRRNLYLASRKATLEALQQLDDALQTVVLVGHNPGVSELAQVLFGRPITFSPAEYVCETLSIARWQDLDPLPKE